MPGERRGQRITLGTDIIRELWHERRPCNWVQIRVGSGRPGRRQKLTSSGKAFLSISHEQFTWEFSRVQKSMSGRCGAITLTGMTSFARTSGRSRRLQLRQTPQDIEGARASKPSARSGRRSRIASSSIQPSSPRDYTPRKRSWYSLSPWRGVDRVKGPARKGRTRLIWRFTEDQWREIASTIGPSADSHRVILEQRAFFRRRKAPRELAPYQIRRLANKVAASARRLLDVLDRPSQFNRDLVELVPAQWVDRVRTPNGVSERSFRQCKRVQMHCTAPLKKTRGDAADPR